VAAPDTLEAGGDRASDGPVFAEGSALESVFGGGLVLTEGVAAAPDGTIFFSDITPGSLRTEAGFAEAGHIWRFHPATGDCTIYRSPSGMANGIVFDPEGRMIVAEGADRGGRRITRTDLETGRSVVLADQHDGVPLNSPNDVTVDRAGRVYFSDPRYIGAEPVSQPLMAVYRIEPDGRLDRIVTDVRKPNGVAIAPDQRRLYVSESDNGSNFASALPDGVPRPDKAWRIYAYDLLDDGRIGSRQLFAELADVGQPDGMTVDVHGNLYVAIARPRSMVCVWSQQGRPISSIDVPEQATNVEFGRGADLDLLYVTAGRSLYRIRTQTRGFHPS
jgi:gluconolactonase